MYVLEVSYKLCVCEFRATAPVNNQRPSVAVSNQRLTAANTAMPRTTNVSSVDALLKVEPKVWLETIVSHVEDPEHFYCQFVQPKERISWTLSAVMDKVQDHIESLSPGAGRPERPYLGQPVVARYSVDGVWYRAKVTGLFCLVMFSVISFELFLSSLYLTSSICLFFSLKQVKALDDHSFI